MRQAHSVRSVRAAEERLFEKTPEGALMERAAAGLAAVCARLLGRVYGARVALLVGSGDNGGDALFAGAGLARRGARVDALLLSPDRAHPKGLAALRAAGGRDRPVTTDADLAPARDLLSRADLILDGIVGIGGRGGLRPVAAALAGATGGAPVVAVDVPSGVDADSGRVEGAAIRADVTVTFGTRKPGLLVDPGAGYAGVVHLVDIGLRPYLPAPAVTALAHRDVAWILPKPTGETDKYRRGVLGVAAGSPRYPGAAVLAVGGALRGGAGAVRYSGPAEVVRAVLAEWPETLATEAGPSGAGRVQAWLAGPGIDTGESARARLGEVLGSGVPVLVDADGLTLLAEDGPRPGPTVLTPHAGEAVRLFAGAGERITREEVEAGRLDAATRLAARYGCVVLLKGSTTVIAGPDGRVRVNPTGSPWLATAGSGDVLSGLAGSLLAAGVDPFDAVSAAAYLHGLAARAIDGPLSASGLVRILPRIWRDVASGPPRPPGPPGRTAGRHTARRTPGLTH